MIEALGLRNGPRGAGFVQSVLRGARRYLNFEVAFVGEFIGDARELRYVNAAPGEESLRAGDSDLRDNTYCQRILDGRLASVIPDAANDPAAMALPVTADLHIGAHVGVPVTLSDGSVFGSLCAFSHRADNTLTETDGRVMGLLATLVADHIEAQKRAAEEEPAAHELRGIIDARAITTVFQPICALDSGIPIGFEALSRFASGRTDEWFRLAGETGMRHELEMLALTAAAEHLPALPLDTYLAVNVSPAVMCSLDFIDFVRELPCDRLLIELTETGIIHYYPDLLKRLGALRRRGARIAVDDAGAGNADLYRIIKIAPDHIKLDRQLIENVDSDPTKQSMVRAMLSFAATTGARLVAEGIETQAERHVLLELGVRYGQGYLLGRPVALPSSGAGIHGSAPVEAGADAGPDTDVVQLPRPRTA